MKKQIFGMCWILIFCMLGFSQQEIKLSDINKPGEDGVVKQTFVLAENLFGPHKVVFSGNAPGGAIPTLSKEEQGKSGSFDKLEVLFSGKIYSSNMTEPIIFENKTPEELVLMEISIFPTILEQPFTLFMDLSIKASSKPIGAVLSDDAGTYSGVLIVRPIKL